MDIKIGEIYYFNNREILILKQETDEMYLVCGDFDITNEITGSCFCEACNIGDNDNKLSHSCFEIDEIIETVMDDISDKNIFWVSKKYINEKPFEYKKNTKLLEEISTNNNILEGLKTDIKILSDTKSLLEKNIKDNELIIQTKIEEIDKKEIKLSELYNKISNFSKYKSDMLSNKSLRISSSTLLELIKSDIILNKLNAGGVDNWDWYSESIGDDDIDLLAIEQIKNYIK